jgi:23S rRNA (uracil1939-C5)-methyltransferase
VTPRCAHFGECGGCDWQHLRYTEQLRLKTELVTRLVQKAVPRAPEARPTLPGASVDHPWGFRHKVHFVFGSSGRQRELIMGHYARGSRRVIPVRECPVHDENGNALAFMIRDVYAAAGISAAPPGTLKSVAIRVAHGTSEVAATVVVSNASDKRLRAATRTFLDAPGAPDSFNLNVHPRGDPFIFGQETRRVAGRGRMREEVGGISFLVSPTTFFQTNVRAAEILVSLVREAVPPRARVLDLYAGAGLFALPLARAGHTVTAVEESRHAVADGEASRAVNRIPAEICRFVTRRVEDAIRIRNPKSDVRGLENTAGGRVRRYDAVVLDPPRDGCSPTVLRTIFGELAPHTAVYVSCNPETLARDLGAIVPHGYRVESLQPVDMFPHTTHIEVVAVLKRVPEAGARKWEVGSRKSGKHVTLP